MKTEMEDIPLSNKLKSYKIQSVNEILNQPLKEKKKFSFNFFGNKIRKGFLNNTIISPDMNKPLLNLDIFNNLEVLTEPTFKVAANRTMSLDINKNNTFKILLKENYSQYISILKNRYPSFKFNHYKKYKKEFKEYIKKYGEEGDINNRHFHSINNKDNELNSFRFNNKIKDNKKYKKSNLLEILGAQENIECDPKMFKIKDDFLSRNDCTELKMIQKDLQFKTGIIEKELDYILMTYPQQLYNYIEDNRDLSKKLKECQILLLQRRLQKKRVVKNYINNSAKIIMKGLKIKQNLNFLKILKEINEINKSVQNLKMITISESENKIKKVNDAINLVKDNLKKFNNKYNKEKKYKFILEIEKIIKKNENIGEENLNDQFNINIKKLLNNCLKYFDKNNGNKHENNNDIELLIKKWDLSKEKDVKNKISFLEKDFNLTEIEDNIFVKYLLIYNNLKNSDNNILILLISILDMFEIIIKDNLDINIIVSTFQDVFIKLINKNYEIIQNLTTNKLLMLKILSNCFSIILSNYFYIIILIQNNFGFRIKIFGEVTELIKKEMDKNIINLLNEYYSDVLLVNHWKYFIYEAKEIQKNTEIYFNYRKLNYFNLTIDKYKEYTNNFNNELMKELDEKLNEFTLNWEEKKDIDFKYQKMFDILYSNKEILQLNFDEIDIKEKSLNNNKIDFICINNERLIEKNDINHKVSNFSLEIINYIYNYLLVFVDITEKINYNNIILGDSLDNQIDQGIRNNLIIAMYQKIKEKLEQTKNIMIDNKSGILNDKQITDKETCIYYSDLIIIQSILNQFLLFYPEQGLVSILNNLTTTCVDLIVQLIKDTINKTCEDFNKLNFEKYPIINGGKGYNNYVNNFTILKRIYDNMNNSFNKNQINKVFIEAFSNLFNNFDQSIENNGIIEIDDQLRQFRSEFNYIKKVLKLFPLINSEEFKDLIDKLIIKINPNKLPSSKKKKALQNKLSEDKI